MKRFLCHKKKWTVKVSQPRSLKISEIESFATLVNDFQLLVVFAKLSVSDVCRGPSYLSEVDICVFVYIVRSVPIKFFKSFYTYHFIISSIYA